MEGERKKRKIVSPSLRAQWLRRLEEGENAPHIANADDWDVRTVRKQLQLARQDREMQEARRTVFGKALERHYSDLCGLAGRVDADLAKGFNRIELRPEDERLMQALKQHMPRSSLWRGMEEWNAEVERLESATARLGQRVRERTNKRWAKRLAASGSTRGHFDGFQDAIVFHMQAKARGWSGLDDTRYACTAQEDQMTAIQHGGYGWSVPNDLVDDVVEFHKALKSEAISWEEYNDLGGCSQRLQEFQGDLRDRLAVIMLRGVVPGRCLYCPF